jgi:hypothetical protein
MTPNQKRNKLRKFIELSIYCGYDITDYLGRPLSYFNFQALDGVIKELELEEEQINE